MEKKVIEVNIKHHSDIEVSFNGVTEGTGHPYFMATYQQPYTVVYDEQAARKLYDESGKVLANNPT